MSLVLPPPLKPASLRLGLSQTALMLGLLVIAPAGCAEGIVLDTPERFPQSELILPTSEPTPEPSPSTPLQKIQVRFVEVKDKAAPYQGYVMPLILGLVALAGAVRFLRWIYDLTTSSPPLF